MRREVTQLRDLVCKYGLGVAMKVIEFLVADSSQPVLGHVDAISSFKDNESRW